MNHRRTISIAASRLIRNVFVDKCTYQSVAYTTGKEIRKANKHKLIKKVLECANMRLKRKKLPSIKKQISNNWWVKMAADYDGDHISHGSGFVEIPMMWSPRLTK